MHGEKNDRGGHKGPPPNGIRVKTELDLAFQDKISFQRCENPIFAFEKPANNAAEEFPRCVYTSSIRQADILFIENKCCQFSVPQCSAGFSNT